MDKRTVLLGEAKYDPKVYIQIWKMLKEADYLYWLPRVLGIGVIAFLALFALDVFEKGKTLYEILIGLFMHLIPNFILAFLLMVSWRMERLGGSLFLLAGFVFWMYFKNPFVVNLVIFGPLLIIGVLFIFHDLKKSAK